MRISSRVAVGSPMARVAFLVILLVILSALTAGSVVVGASLLASPTPPAIARNGLIAYDAGGDIWVVQPDGTDPRQLTSGPAVEHGATWSRDGSRIAYWATDGATAPDTLVIADADGSHPVTIATHEPGRASELVSRARPGLVARRSARRLFPLHGGGPAVRRARLRGRHGRFGLLPGRRPGLDRMAAAMVAGWFAPCVRREPRRCRAGCLSDGAGRHGRASHQLRRRRRASTDSSRSPGRRTAHRSPRAPRDRSGSCPAGVHDAADEVALAPTRRGGAHVVAGRHTGRLYRPDEPRCCASFQPRAGTVRQPRVVAPGRIHLVPRWRVDRREPLLHAEAAGSRSWIP